MIKKLFTEYVGFPIQDLVKKTSILSTLEFLKKSQNWSEERRHDYRLLKLQELVNHSYSNVPYYTELFDSHGISPDDIKTLEDIKKIPILTKELARINQDKLVAENSDFKYVKKRKTGGTTGVPLVVYSDAVNRSFTWASYYRWYNWIGIAKEDKVVTLWGTKTVLKTSIRTKVAGYVRDWIQNNKTINAFNLAEETLPDVYQQIEKFNPVLIKGYLSSIVRIAKFMQKNDLSPNKNLKAISTTSETLLPIYRNLLQDVFGVPVYDQYGCGEVSAISYECSKHKGLHINEEHVYVESLDEDDAGLFNKTGRLVVTSLNNYVMPFIRYETGDMGALLTERCDCELNYPLMSPVDGRAIDTIKLKDGSEVHGVFFTDLFFETGITTDLISRFQIFQYKTGAIDIKLESQDELSESLLHQLEAELLRFVDKVNIILVSEIPNEQNGKFKYLKCEGE